MCQRREAPEPQSWEVVCWAGKEVPAPLGRRAELGVERPVRLRCRLPTTCALWRRWDGESRKPQGRGCVRSEGGTDEMGVYRLRGTEAREPNVWHQRRAKRVRCMPRLDRRRA